MKVIRNSVRNWSTLELTLLLAVLVLTSCISGGTRPVLAQNDSSLDYSLVNLPGPDSARSLGSDQADWYKDAVFYHVWVNAFNDSDGDGVGDLNGIRQRLDYLQQLGVNALWLSPFFASSSEPINLHMYDTTDHYTVDPRFGTNDDMDALLAEAHERGIRLIFDWVPNHVSSEHPWFLDSAAGLEGKKDWFVWRNPAGSQNGPWGQRVWHGHANGSYYYGVFWSGMPDINFRNAEARAAMVNVASYWLDRGFDGLRIDAVKYLYEDPAAQRGSYMDQADTYDFFHSLRTTILDAYADFSDSSGRPLHKFMIAENWTDNRSNLQRYMINDGKPAFQVTLDFPFVKLANDRDLAGLDRHWTWQTAELDASAWMGTFLSNHDEAALRPYSRHRETLVRAVTALQLLGPGTPFVYYGNEVGMQDSPQFAGQSHADRRHRQPLPWTAALRQLPDESSLFNFYRELIGLRQERTSLRRGGYELLQLDGKFFAFVRREAAELTLVLVNMGETEQIFELPPPDGSETETLKLLYVHAASEVRVDDGLLQGTLAGGGVLVLGN
ncbi:MAG: glycosidase [Spirochaetes bacterium]|nr:glycosidase [Spirochaetota bacterium]